jgi:hypothetical protein
VHMHDRAHLAKQIPKLEISYSVRPVPQSDPPRSECGDTRHCGLMLALKNADDYNCGVLKTNINLLNLGPFDLK